MSSLTPVSPASTFIWNGGCGQIIRKKCLQSSSISDMVIQKEKMSYEPEKESTSSIDTRINEESRHPHLQHSHLAGVK